MQTRGAQASAHCAAKGEGAMKPRFLSIACFKEQHDRCDGSDCICHCHDGRKKQPIKTIRDSSVCPNCDKVWTPSMEASPLFRSSKCARGECRRGNGLMNFSILCFILALVTLAACEASPQTDLGLIESEQGATFLQQATLAAQRAISERKTATIQAATIQAGCHARYERACFDLNC